MAARYSLLPVPNVNLPATYADWPQVSGQELAAIKNVWTPDVLIVIHHSRMYAACPDAFSVQHVGHRACAPLHEAECLLARALSSKRTSVLVIVQIVQRNPMC